MVLDLDYPYILPICLCAEIHKVKLDPVHAARNPNKGYDWLSGGGSIHGPGRASLNRPFNLVVIDAVVNLDEEARNHSNNRRLP